MRRTQGDATALGGYSDHTGRSRLAGDRRSPRLRGLYRGRRWLWVLGVLGSGALGACSLDGLLKSNELPPNVTDPAITETPDGARAAYYGTLQKWQENGGNLILAGLLSDELVGRNAQNPLLPDLTDLRQLPESPTSNTNFFSVFSNLNNMRQRARQAIGLAGDYLPNTPALQAHLYAAQGYAEVMLAELFCSGIPLSTVDYKGDYTLRSGSSTAEVFTHAALLFDTALAGASDSAWILNLSRVGRARALLGSGDYVAAAAAATEVPDAFRYALHYLGTDSSRGPGWRGFGTGDQWANMGVADVEGGNGLPYRSSSDPRVQVTPNNVFYYPLKYHSNGLDSVVLASGVEARLIEAEAALRDNSTDLGGWLAKLNALRTDGASDPATTVYDTLGLTGCDAEHLCGPDGVSGGTFTLPPGSTLASSAPIALTSELQQECLQSSTYAPCAESPAQTTVNAYDVPEQWHAGTGQVAGLAPLSDPGNDAARVDLLFRERAFWLFLTGHRQGDMRRLVRQYHRQKEQVYPVGPGAFGGEYGSYIDAPIPWRERELNPLFTGCSSRD